MTLAMDLLRQARSLATDDPRRPREASLRRAVSAAYYALFHLLTADAAGRLWPSGPAGIRTLLARTFDHGPMSQASKAFANGHGGLPSSLSRVAPDPAIIPPGLRAVARTFYQLQEERHSADYDLSRRFTRREVMALIARTESAFADWQEVRRTDGARLYLLAILLWKPLSTR